jgi:hypothetical protein
MRCQEDTAVAFRDGHITIETYFEELLFHITIG